MPSEYDVIVVGAGPAGENVAGRCADGGLSVAIVEQELVGGECSYWGCIPSKTLIRPGDVLAAARRVPGAASVIAGGADPAAALKRRDYMTDGWDDKNQTPWLDRHRITLLRGIGRLAGARAVEVEAGGGTRAIFEARRAVVLATGTRAAVPPIEGLADARPWDNRDATSAEEVPMRLLVLGGGAIGCEMAQAFRRLGSAQVVIVEGAGRLISHEEPFAGDEVATSLSREGIRVLVGVTMQSVSREGPGGAVTATLSDGEQISSDEILVSVGRTPATADVGLDTVGIEPGRFLEVDDQLRSVEIEDGWLFGVGDCNGRSLFTHMGKYQGRMAADVILGRGARDIADGLGAPRVTFTDPQVCAVGLTEAQAREKGVSTRCVTYGTGDVSGAAVLGEGIGGTAKLVVDEDRHVVVGATFTGPMLQELLHSATIAVAGEVPLERLWHAVPPFPTVSEVWLRLLEAYGL